MASFKRGGRIMLEHNTVYVKPADRRRKRTDIRNLEYVSMNKMEQFFLTSKCMKTLVDCLNTLRERCMCVCVCVALNQTKKKRSVWGGPRG